MPIAIALIRGINVGGKNRLPMETLRTLCADVGLKSARTLIQSGNVVFNCSERTLASAAGALEAAIEKNCGFRPAVIVRTHDELKRVAAPRALTALHDDPASLDPAKILVLFLAATPPRTARTQLEAIATGPEKISLSGREVYIYFPNGAGQSKLNFRAVDKALGSAGTMRNWNTINKLLAMAEESGLDG